MDLDRNINTDGKDKYALVNLRKIKGNPQTPEELAAAILANPDCVEFGRVGDPDEFFVIKLKDAYASEPLIQYAGVARLNGDEQLFKAVSEMAYRSSYRNPFCKKPD